MFLATLPGLCRVLGLGFHSGVPSVPPPPPPALALCAGYQWWVEGSFESDYSTSVCAHCCCICCAGQPVISLSPAWRGAGAASNPILCSKVKQTSHRPPSLMCWSTPESYLCHCTSPGTPRHESHSKGWEEKTN